MLYIQSFHPDFYPNKKADTPSARLCKSIFERFESTYSEQASIKNMYAAYPTFQIDKSEEQFQLMNANAVIWVFPMHWFNVPPLLKLWMDTVLEYGYAYGSSYALEGKKLQVIVSAYDNKETYAFDGRNKYRVEDLLKPIERVAESCKMEMVPPVVLYGYPNHASESFPDDDTKILGDTEKALLGVQRIKHSFLLD